MDTEGGLVAKPTNNLCDREEEPHNLSLDGAEINPTCDCNVNHDAGERPYMDVPAKLLKLISNKYADHHPGPFEVHIEKYIGIHPPNMWFPISAIFLGKTIHTILPEIWEEAYDLIHLSNLKYSVKFSDRSTANKLVDALYEIRSDIFSHSGWIATIPNYKIFKQVVTRDIDAKTSPKDILEKLSPPPEWKLEWPKLISVEYLGKNTNMFLFTFDCIEPPSSAMYLEKRIQFCFYVPKVTRCLNCQQFGHLNIRCRNGILICEKCAKQGHSGNGCVNPSPKCINCFRRKFGSIDHFASSLSCPTFIEKIKIRIIMAKLACNHKDAFNILKNYGPYLDDKWFDVRIGSKINVHLNSPAENKDDNSKQPNSSNHASRQVHLMIIILLNFPPIKHFLLVKDLWKISLCLLVILMIFLSLNSDVFKTIISNTFSNFISNLQSSTIHNNISNNNVKMQLTYVNRLQISNLIINTATNYFLNLTEISLHK